MATFHEILNELRVSKGVTQEEVANAIGVAKSTFAKYDRGEREPNFATLVKIAQYFETTTDYLLGLSQVAHPIKTRQMAVDIPVNFALTSTEDEIMQIAQDFLSALGPVSVISLEDKKKFFDFVKDVIRMMRFSLCIGADDDLMGQEMGVDDFIVSCADLLHIGSGLLQQAYNKLWELRPDLRPDIHISFTARKETK